MFLRFKILAAFTVLIVSHQSFAQAVVEAAQVQLQAQVRRDAQGFSSCGVRVVALTTSVETMDAYDFSIMVGTDAYGTLKAGKYRTRLAPSGRKADSIKGAVIPGPVNFWIAKELQGKPLLPIKMMSADTPGFILAVGEGSQTLEKIFAIVVGERLQFSLRYKDQPGDTVVGFKGVLSDQERAPIFACIEGLKGRWQHALDSPKK